MHPPVKVGMCVLTKPHAPEILKVEPTGGSPLASVASEGADTPEWVLEAHKPLILVELRQGVEHPPP